jgi:hypothetical protein
MPWVRGDLKTLRSEGSRDHPQGLHQVQAVSSHAAEFGGGLRRMKTVRRVSKCGADFYGVPQILAAAWRISRRPAEFDGGPAGFLLCQRF